MDAPTASKPCAWVSPLSFGLSWRCCLIFYVSIVCYVSMSWFLTNVERLEIRILLNRSGAMRSCACCHRYNWLCSPTWLLYYMFICHTRNFGIGHCSTQKESMAMPRTLSACSNDQNTNCVRDICACMYISFHVPYLSTWESKATQ